MLRLGLTAHIFALLTLAISANEFLPPWTAGSNKDYSNNQNFSVGVNIITEWDADFANATITFCQDNKPGNAQGSPSKTLNVSYNKTVWDWTVTYDEFDPAYNDVFYFVVSQADGSNSFTSHYFNISQAVATTVTTSSSSSTIAETGTTSSSTASLMAPAVSASTTSLPTVAIIAVGIVAGFSLLAGAVWWAWKFKKRRNVVSTAQPLNVDSNEPYLDQSKSLQGLVKIKPMKWMSALRDSVVVLHELEGIPVPELHHWTVE